MLAYARKRLPSVDQAEEAAQETFARAWRHRHALARAVNPEAWLFAVARSVVADQRRRAGRVLPASGAAAEAEAASSWTPLAPCVAPLLAQLPVKYREAVRAADLQGEAQSALALRLGLSPSAARSRVQRGRILLKQALLRCCVVERDARGGLLQARARQAAVCAPACDPGGVGDGVSG
ncbi:putative SigZ family RNA polymerase sigma factor [Magnetofaba australis IT-1]|uniref:Putative SigZ family RNA polymerase sigma factor n=1 Tax=Magnetofaba australis IT-1 TaxID=1434232 RepID=A0A1Y2K0A1_9PROT|nr:putative SigZ family RNA polymerase sigma factor [Magnetofaba australis IT-1]